MVEITFMVAKGTDFYNQFFQAKSEAVDTSRPLEVYLVNEGCVHPVTLKKYANNGIVYANFIKDAKRYKEPKPLSFYVRCPYPWDCGACDQYDGLEMVCKRKHRPPQSWCYLEELNETK